MSWLEMPAGIVDPAPGSREPGPDEAMARRLERALHAMEPDPLFRRRLRGEVVNRYVANREGQLREPGQRRRMGTIGRSVLYASLLLALGVSAVGAAAQESLPGEPLYLVKLRLEEFRMRIAPSSVRDDLAAMALAERIEELERLAAADAWSLVPAAAARVSGAQAVVLTMEPGPPAEVIASDHAIEVLEAVLLDAPEAAQSGLERAIEAAGGKSSGIVEPGRSPSSGAAPGTTRHGARPARDGDSD